MKTALLIIIIIILVIVFFIAYRLLKIKIQRKRLSKLRFDRISPLYDKLESGQPVTVEEVLPYAENLSTREMTFHLLQDHDLLALFPEDYLNLVSGAESNLANWLEFPTELDACPDEMEHIKRVTFDFDGAGNFVHYEVFKYRVNAPHWAGKDGWIFGVVGPYFDDSKPYDFPSATFSRVGSTVNRTSADEEAQWVHQNISLRK